MNQPLNRTEEELFRIAEYSFSVELRSMEATLSALDPAVFRRAVYALAEAERTATSGCGHSGIACMHFAHSLCCIERPARFLSPSEALHGGSGFVRRGDMMVLASRGGKTGELLPLLDICRAKGVTVLCVTENPSSPLAAGADLVLPMRVTAESDKYNSQGTSSFVALVAMFDALQSAVLEVTGYRNEQFALIHPGGAVGERLNSKSDPPNP